MGDIWLPGLPPAYSDYAQCLAALAPHMPTHDDAVILAAIAGHESGYDYRVINDTAATGDYSCGLYQINYLGSLYASRTAMFGTPRQLIESGVAGQSRAAAALWHEAGGFSPWEADIIGNVWQKWVGSGPVPRVPGGTTPGGLPVTASLDIPQLGPAIKAMATFDARVAAELVNLRTVGGPGWRP